MARTREILPPRSCVLAIFDYGENFVDYGKYLQKL
jgi:hypothetical protein